MNDLVRVPEFARNHGRWVLCLLVREEERGRMDRKSNSLDRPTPA